MKTTLFSTTTYWGIQPDSILPKKKPLQIIILLAIAVTLEGISCPAFAQDDAQSFDEKGVAHSSQSSELTFEGILTDGVTSKFALSGTDFVIPSDAIVEGKPQMGRAAKLFGEISLDGAIRVRRLLIADSHGNFSHPEIEKLKLKAKKGEHPSIDAIKELARARGLASPQNLAASTSK